MYIYKRDINAGEITPELTVPIRQLSYVNVLLNGRGVNTARTCW